jgi:aldose 1-epimerase
VCQLHRREAATGLDTRSSGQTQEVIELRDANAHCTVSPEDGGRIASLTVDGLALLVERPTEPTDPPHPNPMAWGSYPMTPFAGRVRNGRFAFAGNEYQLALNHSPHAIHGTVFVQPWSVNDVGDRYVTMTCPLGDHWPFGGVAHQHIELSANGLVCRLGVTADDLAMPAQVGWHPWFAKPASARLAFARMYQRDGSGIPTGALVPPPDGPWDDCFVEPSGPLELRYEHDGRSLTVTVDSDCDHWVVYDQPHHATCVEPQSGPPDGFNALDPGACTRLEPHATLERTMRLSWTSTPGDPGSR